MGLRAVQGEPASLPASGEPAPSDEARSSLAGIPLRLLESCNACGTRSRRTELQEFGEKALCPACYEDMLTTAREAMGAVASKHPEPLRKCSGCRAMVDPAVGSPWCAVVELGDTRASLCDSFVPLVNSDATAAVLDLENEGAGDLWKLIRSELENYLGPAHLTWLDGAWPASLDDGVLQVQVADEYTRSWLIARVLPAIARTLELHGHPQVVVEFTLRPSLEDVPPMTPSPERESGPPRYRSAVEGVPDDQRGPARSSTCFNAAFTFGQFVVGRGNRLAHAGAMAVAEGALSYNPLLLHGGVGVGKTHLLHAIGGRCLERGSEVLYTTSETFTNDLIAAIRGGSTADFRHRYREIEVLLVDDIQFIIGKDSTQEEFFHTFNWLHDSGKQIVLSCDRPPQEIRALDERLRSRLCWGLLADIQSPDTETRVGILRRRLSTRGRRLSDDVIEYLAGQGSLTVREMEGLMNRLVATAELHGIEPSISLAASLVKAPSQRQRIGSKEVLEAVAAYYRISLSDLTGKQRTRKIATPRHIGMYLLRQEAKLSLTEIGHILGGRDHSTVVYGCDRVEAGVSNGGLLTSDVEAIRAILFASG